MRPVVHKEKSRAVVYDASLINEPGVELFEAEYWEARQAMRGVAIGRGSAWFIEAPFGAVVLRHYLRGGWMARISRQSYIFTGISRSRPFQEFNILAALYEKGLPVPRPIAALCEHQGVLSSGALMMARISTAKTLADMLPTGCTSEDLNLGIWSRVGVCIRQFHDAGVWHADLNARNIMLDENSQVYLIDFDRARFTPGHAVNGVGNLKRLKRSLTKLWPTGNLSAMQPTWTQLEAAYHG